MWLGSTMKSGEYFARAVVALGLSIGLAFVATPMAQAAIAPAAAPVSAHAATSGTSVRPAAADAPTPEPSADADTSTSAPATSTTAPVAPRSLAAQPLAAGLSLVCGTNYAYSIASGGALTQIKAGGSPVATSIGSWTGVSSANGLAIAANGTKAYAYERSGNGISSILTYTPSTGAFAKVANSSYFGVDSSVTSLVAGAVNLSTGHFAFGGFGTAGPWWATYPAFFVYDYDPVANTFSQVGSFRTNSGETNGDMAFDAQGSLYVVSSASSGTTSIYSVTAANYTAGGADMTRTATDPKSLSNGFTGVNGIAFDTDGSVLLGNGSTVRRYDPTTLAQRGSDITTGLSSSTDLASCNSPVNLTVQKNVTGRVNSTDQFTLKVANGATTVASATTTSTAPGLQSPQLGPLAVVAGQTYTISETAASGSLSDYTSSYVCTYGGTTIASGSTASGSVTMPTTGGASVNCVFTNSPLLATVAVHKTVLDINGNNPAPGAGWTLGAATTATTGSATSTPSAATQVTPASGDANWTVAFDKQTSRATVRVSETQKSGWDFVSGSCVVTPLGGSPRTVTLPGVTGADVTGVAPGDAVACTITNKPSAAALTLKKQVDNTYGGGSVISDWTLTATGAKTITGKTGDPSVTAAVVAPGTYALAESGSPAGYAAGAWTCTGATVSGSSVTVAANANAVCTITNASKPGSAVWTKTSKSTGEQLAGSEWTLTGPGLPAQGVVVKDCTAGPCTGLDQDPTPGAFRLDKLAWGTYTAKETLAPAGYIAAGSFTFTVSAANAGTTLNIGAQQNEQQAGAVLPLTGGLGSDAFLLGGGALLFSALAVLGVLRLRRNARRAS